MTAKRQRHLAWLFLLVLALGMAVLCCACVHVADHACCGHDTCAICAFLRGELRQSALCAVLLIALAAVAHCIALPVSGHIAPIISLFTLRVRLND